MNLVVVRWLAHTVSHLVCNSQSPYSQAEKLHALHTHFTYTDTLWAEHTRKADKTTDDRFGEGQSQRIAIRKLCANFKGHMIVGLIGAHLAQNSSSVAVGRHSGEAYIRTHSNRKCTQTTDEDRSLEDLANRAHKRANYFWNNFKRIFAFLTTVEHHFLGSSAEFSLPCRIRMMNMVCQLEGFAGLSLLSLYSKSLEIVCRLCSRRIYRPKTLASLPRSKYAILAS